MVTRISGTIAVGALFFALSLSLILGINAYDDGLNKLHPPKLVGMLFLLAPAGWLLLVNSILFMTWYWLLSAEAPQPRTSLIWHILGVVMAATIVAVALSMNMFLMHMDGYVSPTTGRWVVSALITSGLAFAVYRAWKRSRPSVR